MSILNEERLELTMEEEGLDVLIATTIDNIQYATNYRSFTLGLIRGAEFLAVIPRKELAPRVLIAPVGEVDRIAEEAPQVEQILPYGVFSFQPPSDRDTDLEEADSRLLDWGVPKPKYNSAVDALRNYIDSHGMDHIRLGVDEVGIGLSGYERIRDGLPNIEIKPAYSTWQWIRRIKTKEEIGRLRKAVGITEQAMKATMNEFREGIEENDLEVIYIKSLIEQGARPSFAVIAFGSHSAYPNAAITNRKLARGDTVRFDVGCTYKGYHADISRTAIFGTPSKKTKDYYKAILLGEETAIEKLHPGIKANEIFNIAVETTRQMGIKDYERNHVGHGIGIEVYDPPILRPSDESTIEEGMVFCVETPFYEIGWTGLQVEDAVLVTNDGPEYLTTMSRDLIVV